MPLYVANNLFSDCWSSVGDVTFFHIDGRCYWKRKAQPVFPGTAGQLEVLDVHRRALAAWRGVPDVDKKLWNEYATAVPAHRPPFDGLSHISGYNLFVSAYHGFARLGCERVPEPVAFVGFPAFGVDVVSASVADGRMDIVCALSIRNCADSGRYRLLAKLQLVKPGRSYHSGKMRTYLAEEIGFDENVRRLVRFTIPDYAGVFGLDLREYGVHFRMGLIDEVSGYRSLYQKLSAVLSID